MSSLHGSHPILRTYHVRPQERGVMGHVGCSISTALRELENRSGCGRYFPGTTKVNCPKSDQDVVLMPWVSLVRSMLGLHMFYMISFSSSTRPL